MSRARENRRDAWTFLDDAVDARGGAPGKRSRAPLRHADQPPFASIGGLLPMSDRDGRAAARDGSQGGGGGVSYRDLMQQAFGLHETASDQGTTAETGGEMADRELEGVDREEGAADADVGVDLDGAGELTEERVTQEADRQTASTETGTPPAAPGAAQADANDQAHTDPLGTDAARSHADAGPLEIPPADTSVSMGSFETQFRIQFATHFHEIMHAIKPLVVRTSPEPLHPPVERLFTPAEQQALFRFMTTSESGRELPPLGTFGAFFARPGVDTGVKLLFSGALHIMDRRLTNGQRVCRANDCGDWVARVRAYAGGQAYVSRVERRKLGMRDPGVLARRWVGFKLLPQVVDGPRRYRPRAAVSRSAVEGLKEGDWIQYHWKRLPRPGEADHSVQFVRFLPDGRPHWSGGYVRMRVMDQASLTVGGGNYRTLRLCVDPTQHFDHVSRHGYIYAIGRGIASSTPSK